MQSDKIIKYLNWLIIFSAIVAIIVLLFGRNYFRANDLNMVPVALIIVYTALNGVKLVVSGKQKMGYPLIFFSIVVAVMAVVLKMAAL